MTGSQVPTYMTFSLISHALVWRQAMTSTKFCRGEKVSNVKLLTDTPPAYNAQKRVYKLPIPFAGFIRREELRIRDKGSGRKENGRGWKKVGGKETKREEKEGKWGWLHQVWDQICTCAVKAWCRKYRHASPHLWNQLPTSLRIPHPNYSCPSQRPSFEQTSLTCYTLLSRPSITFSLFHSELKTYLFRKSYLPP